jgi:hypothetical protein
MPVTVLEAEECAEGAKPTALDAGPALYLRSVCWITTAFRGLRCHPLTCMLLNLRLSADSIPSALTNVSITWKPHPSCSQRLNVSVREAGEPAKVHPHAEIGAFNERRGNPI